VQKKSDYLIKDKRKFGEGDLRIDPEASGSEVKDLAEWINHSM
jgi:hypothetical protein